MPPLAASSPVPRPAARRTRLDRCAAFRLGRRLGSRATLLAGGAVVLQLLAGRVLVAKLV